MTANGADINLTVIRSRLTGVDIVWPGVISKYYGL